jgi:hypothetical protein
MIDPTGGAATSGQRDPSTVYDGGVSRPVLSAQAAGGMAASALTLVAAAAGLRTKVLAVSAICSAFTTAGSCYLRNAGGATLYWLGRVGAANENLFLDLGGTMLTQTAVNTALEIYFDGNANFGVAVTYYQAP